MVQWTQGATAGPFSGDSFTRIRQDTVTFPAERGETGEHGACPQKGPGNRVHGGTCRAESSKTLSSNAHRYWLSLHGMPRLSCLLVILEMEQ